MKKVTLLQKRLQRIAYEHFILLCNLILHVCKVKFFKVKVIYPNASVQFRLFIVTFFE